MPTFGQDLAEDSILVRLLGREQLVVENSGIPVVRRVGQDRAVILEINIDVRYMDEAP